MYDEIYDFPLFHSGIEYEDYPKIIKEYIAKLDKSDHIVMAIPEYIRGVPATLKNAIEWLLASNILYKKPVSFKVSSARGDACYDNLITFLKFLNPKLHEDGMLCYQEEKDYVMKMVNSFIQRLTINCKTLSNI